jgi:hypothetical protein
MKLLRLFIITTLLMALPAQAVRTNELVGSFKIAADLARRSSQELAVKQAAAIITTVIASTPDTDGDPFPEPPAYLSGSGPTGGGLIPTGLGAPINDGYGAKLGYCAWDNGSVMSGGNRLNGSATNTGAVTFAVVSAGLDGVFNRTCAQIASGAATTDDDFVVSVSTAQIRQGVGGTVYFADPVADMTALGLLNSASQTVGAMRLVKSDNTLWRWDGSIWQSVANTYAASNVTITGGTINNTMIGNTTPSSGVFTTLIGSLTGNVTGNLTGNVTGNLVGNVTGNVTGNAGTATRLFSPRTIGITGDASWSVSFDGSANTTGVLALASTGVGAGSYGSSVSVPSFTVDAKGRLTAAANVAITPSLSSLTGAAATNTIGNGAYAQSWNWQLAGNTSAFSVGETAASTGGSGAQTLLNIGTLAGSTAIPLRVSARGVEAFRVDSVNPQLVVNNGSISAPGYTFAGDQSTGLFLPAAGQLAASVAGKSSLWISSNNTAVGNDSLPSSTTGASNIAAGSNALKSNTTGANNSAFGHSALTLNTTGYDNIAVGKSAMSANTTGFYNTAIGNYTLQNITTSGVWNVALGNNALNLTTTGQYNVAAGGTALESNTTGSYNAAVGNAALKSNSTGRNNVALGSDSLNGNTTGNFNVAIGRRAGYATSGGSTTNANTTGTSNTFVGAYSLPSVTTLLDHATALGADALVGTSNTIVLGRAADTTVIGATADDLSGMKLQVTGGIEANSNGNSEGLIVTATHSLGLRSVIKASPVPGSTYNNSGVYALNAIYRADTSATDDITWKALSVNRNGINYAYVDTVGNAFFNGTGAFAGAVTGASFSGSGALLTNLPAASITGILAVARGGTGIDGSTAGNGQLLIGNGSGFTLAALTGTANQIIVTPASGSIGLSLPQNIATTSTPSFSGLILSGALNATNGTVGAPAYTFTSDTTTGLYRPAAGQLAASVAGVRSLWVTAGSLSLGIGALASDSAPSTNNNVALGSNALQSNTTGINNVATGYNALKNNTTASFNVATGNSALESNTTGSANAAFGNSALKNNSSGFNNVGVGSDALSKNTTGTSNIAIGKDALFNNIGGSYNVASGGSALTANTTGSDNAAIGEAALKSNSTGRENVAIGSNALQNNTTGDFNVAIGRKAGYATSGGSTTNANTTGTSNTFIGAFALPGVATLLDHATALGADALVSTSSTIVLGRAADTTVIGANADDLSGNRLQVSGGIKATSNGNGEGLIVTATHSLGLSSVIKASPVPGSTYNNSGVYALNAIYRADTSATDGITWKALSVNRNGINYAYIDTVGNAFFNGTGAFTGAVTGASFSGSGALLTNLPAASITGILAVARGGTGIDGSTAGNGQLLIGNGSGFTLATLSGTANQVTVTNSAGGITLALPQSIAAASSPTFGGLTLSGGLGGTTGSFSSTLGVTGATTLGSTLAVTGATTLSAGLTGTTGTFSGAVSAASFSGNGASFTALNGSNISSGTVSAAYGGTGVNGSTAANGQLLIGNGSGYTLGTLTAGAGVSITNGAGIVTLANTGVTSFNTRTGAVILYKNDFDSPTSHNNESFRIGFGASQTPTGNFNTAVGQFPLYFNNGGGSNTAVGAAALYINVTGNSNTAIGRYALAYALANSNTATGANALYGATGDNNTANGEATLNLNTTGTNNVALGRFAGYATSGSVTTNANTTGSNNTFLSSYAMPGTTTQLTYATALGASALVTTSSTIALGRTSDNVVISATGDDSSGNKLQVTGGIKATGNGTLGGTLAVTGATTLSAGLTGTTGTFSGAISAASISGSGASLTALNGSNISSGTVSAAYGGTGVNGSAAANGQLLIGNGSGYTLDGLAGTANQIIVTPGSGSIGLSLPQDIATTSAPTFAAATVSGNATVGGNLTVSSTAGITTVRELRMYANNSSNVWDHFFIKHDGFNTTLAAGGANNGMIFKVSSTNAGDIGSQTYNTVMTLQSDLTATFTGAVSATSFSGSGTSLTALNGSNISSGTVGAAYGGTGINGSTAGNGQLLIGNGSGFTLATLTGTANQVTVTNSAGGITLALPQNIAAASSPTFAGLTLSGGLSGTTGTFTGNLTALRLGLSDSTGSVSWPNLVIGSNAMQGAASGFGGNTAVGISALNVNTSGYANTAFGRNTLAANLTGRANNAIGMGALTSNTTGINNTADGNDALYLNTSGQANTALGRWAGYSTVGNATTNANISGNNNTFIGSYAMPGTATQLTYATALGSDALVTTSSTIALGRTSDNVVIGATGDDASGNKLQVTGGIKASGNATIGGTLAVTGATTLGGNLTMTAASPTITTASTSLQMQQTGDQYGTTRLTLLNRTGANGAMFENTSLDLVDLIFKTSTAAQANLRYEHRSGFLTNSGNTNGEFQFYDITGANFMFSVGPASTTLNVGNFGIGVVNPGYKLAVGGTANVTGATTLGSTLAVTGATTLSAGLTGTTGTFSGAVSAASFSGASGSAGAPSHTFSAESTSGLYLPAAGQLAASVQGTRGLWINNGNSIAVGTGALAIDSGGNYNTAIGSDSLPRNTTGQFNVAVGYTAGYTFSFNVSGGRNTFIGMNASPANDATTASSGRITLIGADTKATLGSTTANAYMTAIGSSASVTTVNTIVLGRSAGQDNVVIGQDSAGGKLFYVNGSAGGSGNWNAISDIRYKMNITPVVNAINTIKSLQGVHYDFNRAAWPDKNFETNRQLGFIAQQIEPFVPEVVSTDTLGYKSVQYAQVVALLAEGIKEQQLVLQHLVKKNPATLLVDIKTFQGNDAVFENIKSTTIKTANFEAETARIKKLDADRIDTRYLRSDVMKTGETVVFVSLGSFQPIFMPLADAQYIVNATAEDGSSAFASVAFMGGKITVTPISGKGVDVTAMGSQVGLVAASKTVKATWIRMS